MLKDDKKKRRAALARLKQILKEIRDCKARGVAPPFGLLAEAEKLADLFPDVKFRNALKEIIAIEQEIYKEITQENKSSFMDINSFKELIAKDPFKAAEIYFEREEIKKLNNTINKINNGKVPPIAEFIDYIKLLREERQNREALCPALAVNVEKLKLEMQELREDAKDLVQEKIQKAEEHLSNLGEHKIHAAVCNKHRDRRKAQGLDHSDETIAKEDGEAIVKDVCAFNKMLEKVQILAKDISAVPENIVESFVKTEDTQALKVEVEKQKVVNYQAAQEKLAREKAEAAVKEAVKEGEIVEVKSIIKHEERQEEVVNTNSDVDKEAQKESIKQTGSSDREAKKAAREAKRLAKESSMDMIKALKENAVGTGSSSVARSKSSGKGHSYNQDM